MAAVCCPQNQLRLAQYSSHDLFMIICSPPMGIRGIPPPKLVVQCRVCLIVMQPTSSEIPPNATCSSTNVSQIIRRGKQKSSVVRLIWTFA